MSELSGRPVGAASSVLEGRRHIGFRDEAEAEETERFSVPGMFGKDGKTFVPPALAEAIAGRLRITRGPGGGLWYDAGGVYRPGAEDLVQDLVRRALGSDYRANRANEVLSYLKTFPVTISATPPPEHLLNVANGVLDLRTLELRPALDSERFTHQLPVAWNPHARCPKIEAFIREVVPEDCVSLVTEILGLALMPTARYRRAVMLLGSGSNGKSVLLSLFKALLGEENAAAVTLQKLAEDRFATALLFGRLADIAGDLDSRPLARSDAFKMLTGGDYVTAEHKYGHPFQFVNYATLIFSANEWPVSHDQSDAYFTRWIAIPFPQRYREDDGPLLPGEKIADLKLLDRLKTPEELEGLLVAAVKGARRLRERGGFKIPDSVREAVADYREWADTVLAWSLENVSGKPEHRITRGQVFGSYQDWCRDNGRSSVASKRFWPKLRESLEQRGISFEEIKSGERYVVGITILEGGA